MAGELQHADIGPELTRAEWEAITAHVLQGQQIGDIIFAVTATVLGRLGIGAQGQALIAEAGLPSWRDVQVRSWAYGSMRI